jgi:hypothetical protein
VSDQTYRSAVSWRRVGSELRRHGSERCWRGGAACRKRRIRASVGVEWLSVGTADHSDVDAEARRIRVAATLRCGELERRRCGGATGQSCGSDVEAWLVRVTAMTRRRGGSQAAVIWRCARSGCHPPFLFKPYYGSGDPLPFRSRARARAGSVASVVGTLVACSIAWCLVWSRCPSS